MLNRVVRRVRELLGPREDLVSEADRYWRQGDTSEKIREFSHWRGEGRFEDDGAWLEIGRSHKAIYEDACRLLGKDPASGTMLEWGPGGGSNLLAFSGLFGKLIGVDISDVNLEKCSDELVESGVSSFQRVHFPAEAPESVAEVVALGSVDFLLSTAVFQHFPSKEYGVRVLEVGRRLLRPGGLALIQVRYDDGNPKFAPKNKKYSQNAIYFTSYRIEEFWSIATTAGFEPLWLTLRPRVNYAFFVMEAKQEAAG